MPNKLKKVLARLIAATPTNAARMALYRGLLGYRLGAGCRLAWGVVIAVDAFEAGAGVTVRRGTIFEGPITVHLGRGTFIGRRNRIECGESAADANRAHMGYARRFETGEDSLIHEDHLFDVYGEVRIGNRSWVAGFGSQFLTHGAGVMDRDIRIGDRCFIGSAARFAPGSGLGDGIVLAMGSVVAKRIDANDALVGGVPAKVLKPRDGLEDYVFQKVWT